MKRYICLVVLCACGGDPFYASELFNSSDAATVGDSRVDDSSVEHANNDDASVIRDASTSIDHFIADTYVVDSYIADTFIADTFVCAPIPSHSYQCSGSPVANVPGEYCTAVGGANATAQTPPECQCAATYTCSCITAHVACPPPYHVSCDENGQGTITVGIDWFCIQ